MSHPCHVLMTLTLATLVAVPGVATQEPSPPPTTNLGEPTGQELIHGDRLRRVAAGAALPDFSLETIDGAEIKRSDYVGRTLVLVYLAAEQRNSERAAADASRVVKAYANEPLDLLFVTADFGHEAYFATLIEEAHLSAPLGFDTGHTLYSELGLIVFPSTLVINAEGRLDRVILTRRSDYSHLLDAYVGHALGLLDTNALEQRIVAPSMSRSSPKTMAQRHRESARLLRDHELLAGAEAELLRAVELAPESTPIRIDLADLYISLDRHDEASSLLGGILAADGDHRGARLLLGISRFRTGQLAEAEEILLDALVLNPDPERTHYFLGRIYEAQGDHSKAISHYRHALDRLLDETASPRNG